MEWLHTVVETGVEERLRVLLGIVVLLSCVQSAF